MTAGRQILAALAAACAFSGAAVAIGNSDDENGAGRAPGLPRYERPPEQVTAPDAEQRQAFTVLGRAAMEDDRLPPSATAIVASALRRDFGVNGVLARRAALSEDTDAYLVPGRSAVCIVDSHGTAGCNSTEAAELGQLATVAILPNGTRRVVGAVPDGVREVEVLGRETSTVVAVQDNAYVATLDSAVTGARYSDGGQERQIFLSSP
jgi:hypothetical protein